MRPAQARHEGNTRREGREIYELSVAAMSDEPFALHHLTQALIRLPRPPDLSVCSSLSDPVGSLGSSPVAKDGHPMTFPMPWHEVQSYPFL